MAIYRLEAKAISRGQGRSCVAAAAYRHAEKLHDERQQLTHGYERKRGVVHSEIIAPDNAPDWARNRGELWNHIDAAEKRKDAMTAREILVALPRELNPGQQVDAVRAFVREEFTARGIIADVAIHEPDARDGEKQPHAHIMVSDRPLDPGQPNGLAAKKDRTLSQAEGVEAIRERWATHCNRALERAGLGERVDHHSLADQRRAVLVVAADNTRPQPEREEAEQRAILLDRPPEPKIGPVALRMERQGRGEEAHALRDALAVREDRTLLARLAATWRQVRDQVAELRQVVTRSLRPAIPADPFEAGRAAGAAAKARYAEMAARLRAEREDREAQKAQEPAPPPSEDRRPTLDELMGPSAPPAVAKSPIPGGSPWSLEAIRATLAAIRQREQAAALEAAQRPQEAARRPQEAPERVQHPSEYQTPPQAQENALERARRILREQQAAAQAQEPAQPLAVGPWGDAMAEARTTLRTWPDEALTATARATRAVIDLPTEQMGEFQGRRLDLKNGLGLIQAEAKKRGLDLGLPPPAKAPTRGKGPDFGPGFGM